MSVKKNILITDRFSQESWFTLKNQPFLNVEKSPTPDLSSEDVSKVHGLIIRSRTIIDESILTKAGSLQVIVTATSGFDHIDLKAAEKWGVTVMFTPEAHVESAAQLTWALLLAGAQQLVPAHQIVKAGHWRERVLPGIELHRKTYGIVGLGRIGSRVAEIAKAFKMKVLAYDPYIEDDQFKSANAERVSLDELLRLSDIISFHVPATQETKGLLNKNRLDGINTGAIVINTSRGSVMREQDLHEALVQNKIFYAGLDVFEREPLPSHSPLRTLQNVLLTPHIGAYTHEAFQKASEMSSLKTIRFFIDGSTSDTLPPKQTWYGAQVHFHDNKS